MAGTGKRGVLPVAEVALVEVGEVVVPRGVAAAAAGALLLLGRLVRYRSRLRRGRTDACSVRVRCVCSISIQCSRSMIVESSRSLCLSFHVSMCRCLFLHGLGPHCPSLPVPCWHHCCRSFHLLLLLF